MIQIIRRSGWFVLLLAMAQTSMMTGCATVEETANGGSDGATRTDARLVSRSADVASIQLYRTGNEGSLALLPLESGETLTLAFDVLGSDSRPLSVWFYHADREWRRDLVPAEYLDSFDHDDLFDYATSRTPHVPYVHYRYTFPGQNIRFRLSGNYYLSVTEQGQEDAVLFERPFYVAEQGIPVDFALDNVMIAGSSFGALQPMVMFTPSANQATNAFDFSVCFMRNGQAASQRCATRPSLAMTPALQYYLEPDESFGPQPEDHFVDLADIRVGPRVVSVDLSLTPYEVVLEPDYMRFPGTPGAPLQFGNPVIDASARTLQEPAVSAEYMNVRFSLVPDDEAPVRGSVYLLGSFNDWRMNDASRMTWNAETGRYVAEVLLKQGRYEYRYGFGDRAVARDVFAQALPRPDNVFSAFVYYRDVRVGTDRLVSAVSVQSR